MSGRTKNYQPNVEHLEKFGWHLVVVNEQQRDAENINHDDLCEWVIRNSRHPVICEKIIHKDDPKPITTSWFVFEDGLDAELCRWRWNHDE